MLGSVAAVTHGGWHPRRRLSRCQPAGQYAYTSGKVILVVGSKKIVPDLETALRRIREHVLP
jgi:hypothetical protein